MKFDNKVSPKANKKKKILIIFSLLTHYTSHHSLSPSPLPPSPLSLCPYLSLPTLATTMPPSPLPLLSTLSLSFSLILASLSLPRPCHSAATAALLLFPLWLVL